MWEEIRKDPRKLREAAGKKDNVFIKAILLVEAQTLEEQQNVKETREQALTFSMTMNNKV